MGRPAGISLGANYDVSYGYDAYGRMNQVAWNVAGANDQVTYGRATNSDLLSGLSYASGLTTTYDYEPKRDLKTQVKNIFGAGTISQYDYAYDAIGRRTSVANSGSAFSAAAFNKWSYNDRNELIDASRYLGTDVTQTNSPVAAEHRAYGFDAIGNRTMATEGSQQKSYQANLLNEYTTAAGATLSYDADGNFTSDGGRKFTYDAENRLTLVEPVTAVNGSTRVRMAYDYLGRRVQKVVEEFDGSAWAAADDVRFVYLGWNVLEERRSSGGVTTRKNFVWGLDLSQSMDGAGGIGGLLGFVDDQGTQMAFLYDTNGNVGQLVDEGGSVVAKYEYDAFGQVLVAEGPAANENSYRFSTKMADVETGLVYYGYRFYDAGLGRWVNRDPAGEDRGGENLFAMVVNRPVDRVDALGLFQFEPHSRLTQGAIDFLGKDCLCLSEDDRRHLFSGMLDGVLIPDEPDGFFALVGVMALHAVGLEGWVDDTLTYQSHFGANQFWHAMYGGESAAIQIQAKIAYRAREKAAAFQQLMKAEKFEEAGSALGEILHTLQDSYSASHARRNSGGEIEMYQDYNLQDSGKHGNADLAIVTREAAEEQNADISLDSYLGFTRARQASGRFLQRLICERASAESMREWIVQEVLVQSSKVKAGGTDPRFAK